MLWESFSDGRGSFSGVAAKTFLRYGKTYAARHILNTQ